MIGDHYEMETAKTRIAELEQGLDEALAEAGALRDVLEHAIELGYLGEGSTRGMAQDALDTAPRSRAIAAVINRAKMLSWEDLPDGNYLIGKHAAERLIRALEALERVRK